MSETDNGERRDDKTILAALEAVRSTVDTLKASVGTLDKTVSMLGVSVELQRKMIYGYDDPEHPMQHIPGLRDLLAKHEFWLKWGGLGFTCALGILVLKALGLPTELVGKALHTLTGIGQ